MSETSERTKLKRAGKILSLLALSVAGLLLLIVLALWIYLSTSLPASQLSKLVTAEIKQQFTVEKVRLSGRTLILEGVRLENPAGFPKVALVSADSSAVAPQWWSVLRGGQRFRLIDLRGIAVNLEKDARGVWNFAHLQQTLARKKPEKPPVETFIRELRVKDGAVKVQGQGVQGISLRVFDLATGGSRESEFNISFEDLAQNQYQLKGKARPGKDAALDLALKAPKLDLEKVALLLKQKNPALFRGGIGGLQVDATLHGGELATRGDFRFGGLQLPVAGGRKALPVEGALDFAVDYSSRSDEAKLLPSTMRVENLAKVTAEGAVRGVSGTRQYRVRMAMNQVDLAILNLLLSESSRKSLLYGGRISGESFEITGDRSNGLTSAVGTLRLGEGKLSKGDDLLVDGLSGTATLSRRSGAIVANGKLVASRGSEAALFQSLDLPLNLTLSRKFKLLEADFPALSATVKGVPLRGRITYQAANASPLFAALQIPPTSAPAFNPLLQRYGLQAQSGTASGTVQARGKGAGEITAQAEIQLAALRGVRGKEPFTVKKGSLTTDLERKGKLFSARGRAAVAGAAFNGKAGDADFQYSLNDKQLVISNAQIDIAGSRIAIKQLATVLPERQSAGGVTTYPLHVDVAGATVKQRDLQFSEMTGRLRGSFKSDSNGRWLEGGAELSSKAVWQGKYSTVPAVQMKFSRSGVQAKLAGQALGGVLGGSASFDPFAPASGGSFDVRIQDAKLAAAASLLPQNFTVRPAGGVLDLRVDGRYGGGKALSYRFQSKGNDITLNNAAGRSIVSGASLSASGAMAGEQLTIDQAVVSAGPEVSLRLKGALNQVLSPKREGYFDFSLQRVSLNGIIDPFVNVLPAFIQEATASGSVAAEGRVDLKGDKRIVQGTLQLDDAGLEVPSQKLVVTGVDGKIPFSLDPSSTSGGRTRDPVSFSRENYPKLLEQMRKTPVSGEVVTARKITFGAIEFGKSSFRLSAANGITEISSLSTSIYDGTILGKGLISVRDKLHYRADFLVNDVSLRTVSRTLPIQGYISGRVDGVMSFNGAGKGVANLTGFVHLWAREGRGRKGEKMTVSKEFLQRLAKQKLTGFFFTSDRRYDDAEIKAILEKGDLTFDALRIVNNNMFGVRDLSVTIAPGQNRIALGHLLESIREAATRGKPSGEQPAEPASTPEFKWGE